ncbi:MAG: hypothetical protein HY869_21460 [Chloroflexi bacterium]|nr:hypothetical protein [Chloroflexota bacterium]
MTRRPFSVTVTLGLILFNAVIWLAFGVIVAAHLHPALPDEPAYLLILSVLSLGAALVLSGLAFFLMKHNRLVYFLALAFFGLTTLAFFLDDFGWIDLAFLVINILPAALLLKDRDWYLHDLSHLTSTGIHS